MYKKKKIVTLSLPCFIEYIVFFLYFSNFYYIRSILSHSILHGYLTTIYLLKISLQKLFNLRKKVSIDNNYFISTKFFLIFYIIYICTKKKITKNHSKLIFRLDIWDNNCILYLRKLFISLEISNCTYQLVNDLWRGSLCVISFS